MQNKKYFWFKLKEDFFLSKEIKIIRKMPSGADILIVLFKLQLQALKTGGIIEIDGLCSTIEDELSILIDEDINLLKLSLSVLNKFSLLNKINGNDIEMLLHSELIGSETAGTIRSRKSRNKNKLEDRMLQCNKNATLLQQKCNTDIDIDIEFKKDIELKKETSIIKKENENLVLQFNEIFKIYNPTALKSPTNNTVLLSKFKNALKETGNFENLKKITTEYLEYLNIANWRKKKGFEFFLNNAEILNTDWKIEKQKELNKNQNINVNLNTIDKSKCINLNIPENNKIDENFIKNRYKYVYINHPYNCKPLGVSALFKWEDFILYFDAETDKVINNPISLSILANKLKEIANNNIENARKIIDINIKNKCKEIYLLQNNSQPIQPKKFEGII